MNAITAAHFDSYFQELHAGQEPYSWQRRLAERAVRGDWPGAIDLPTGSGKTACLDVAVFALAAQAALPPSQRSAPRRIFFCANRRVIVDEAFERARRMARLLWEAEGDSANPTLGKVTAALRRIGDTSTDGGIPPLDVLELRGGIYRDNRWARSLLQPTIICTTLDQLGSRLLFRGYGVSPNAAPIQAALVAYDSLILLDEAHISEPFRQTLDFVTGYLDPEKWAEDPVGILPMTVVPMTATPNEKMREKGVTKLDQEDRKSLRNRLTASKPAELLSVGDVSLMAVKEAVRYTGDGPLAVGIIVNRVATARSIHKVLCEHREGGKAAIPGDATIELVIGSMRPIDRDSQSERLRPLIGPDRPTVSTESSFVVATQCLEVGADYDFDVLVTECAALDALRQRFGRLNRSGRDGSETRAAIVMNSGDIKQDDKLDDSKPLDAIYGNAMARTWNWLRAHETDGVVDFGIDALNVLLEAHGANGQPPKRLLSPSASAESPVMMPAYLDLWCQTSPMPEPDPEVSLFIHGPQKGEPDVQVCWRCDLIEDDHLTREDWGNVVSLLPPTAAECMRVPISRMRRWLADDGTGEEDTGDLLGVAAQGDVEEVPGRVRPALLWRGLNNSILVRSASDVRPGDTVVLPAKTTSKGEAGSWDVGAELGHLPELHLQVESALEDESGHFRQMPIRDHAEAGYKSARDRVALRIHPALRHLLPDFATIDGLLDLAHRHCQERVTLREWRDLLSMACDGKDDPEPSESDFRSSAHHLAAARIRVEPYPDQRGVVIVSRDPLDSAKDWYVPPIDDGEDETSSVARGGSVSLEAHTGHVVAVAVRHLKNLGFAADGYPFEQAAELHDIGKADERFQAMLRRTDRTDAWLGVGGLGALLAKSDGLPRSPVQAREARERAGLPNGFRHEMLSVQLAECITGLTEDESSRELLLHLIAAHHGRARPFAPVVLDEETPAVEANRGLVLSQDERRKLVPPHRLDSGIAERFWLLTRRFGWWGLAYLESVLRLADQNASAIEDGGPVVEQEAIFEAP